MTQLRKTQKRSKKDPTGGHFDYGRQGTSTTFILTQMLKEMEECYHVFFMKRLGVNGVYLGRDGMFVKDLSRLRTVKGGLDEPIPRVTAHELGHAFTLKHRQSVTNLMASGTSGWTLNEAEIKQVRTAAGKMKWIRTAEEILKEADVLHKQGKKKEAARLYSRIADIPLHCPETARARKRTGR